MGVAGWTLIKQLLLAIRDGDVGRASQLLAAGVDCDSTFHLGSQKWPALSLCVDRGSYDLVRLLLNCGCSVSPVDAAGATPLHLASALGRADMAALLLQRRAHVNAPDSQRQTPLHHAAHKSDSDATVNLLLDYGAEIDRPDVDGKTPLIHACCHSNVSVALLLLKRGANPNATDSVNNTALHYAAMMSELSVELIQALLVHGAKPDVLNRSDQTPLHLVLSNTHHNCSLKHKVLAALITLGRCDVDFPTHQGHTPLHLACLERDDECARILIRASCAIDTTDRLGHSPLYHLARDGNEAMVRLLLAAGSNPQYLLSSSSIHDISSAKIIGLLRSHFITVPALTSLARLAIRHRFRRDTLTVAKSLFLPLSIQRYLNYYEL